MQHTSLPPVPRLRARTTPIDDPGPLTDLLPDTGAVAWIHHGEGMIGLGEAARCAIADPATASAWWRRVVELMIIETGTADAAGLGADAAGMGAGAARSGSGDDTADVPGMDPLAFGSFVFDPGHSRRTSVLIVPAMIIGHRAGRHWITVVGPAEDALPAAVPPAPTAPPADPGPVAWSDGSISAPAWETAVAEAIGAIGAGRLQKVVLARNVIATTERPLPARRLLSRLAPEFPRCWTFWVDDMVGSTPEMLVRVDRGLVTSRVLAGTIWRGARGPKRRTTPAGRPEDTLSSTAIAEVLAQSDKNLGEHTLAVDSVAHALAPYCTGMNVPETPYVLELPNVMHLATDVTAAVRPGIGALDLAAALHPTAAVCGTPTEIARETITALEGLDRGRYSGPVGWIDTRGEGEWAIALRCGRLLPDGHGIELFAGCGIVADSSPANELAESNAKLMAIRSALEA